MKNLCRFWALVLSALLLLSSCSHLSTTSDDSSPEPSLSGGENATPGAQIALITLEAEHDTPFTQTIWNTISRYSGEGGFTCTSLTVAEPTLEAAQATLELAVKGGAQLVVTTGPTMSEVLSSAREQYPDTDFILFFPNTYQAYKNVYSIDYYAEQGGWLAGYAAVAAGQRSFAYLRADSYEAQRCILGFLLGADAAATDLALGYGEVSVTGITLLPEESLSSLADRLTTFLLSTPATLLINDRSLQAPALKAALAGGCNVIGVLLDPTLLTDGTALLSIQYEPESLLQTALSSWQHSASFSLGSYAHGMVENQDIHLALGTDILSTFSKRQNDQILEYFLDSNTSQTLLGIISDTRNLPEPSDLELSSRVRLR